jgi:hypothetical protein
MPLGSTAEPERSTSNDASAKRNVTIGVGQVAPVDYLRIVGQPKEIPRAAGLFLGLLERYHPTIALGR